MPSLRRGAASTVLADGSVLIVGGVDSSSQLKSMIRYDPAAKAFSLAGLMDAPYDSATLLNDGKVLLTGRGRFIALGPNDTVLTSAELYDPADGSLVSTGPMLEGVNSATANRLEDGRVLIAGGKLYNQVSRPSATGELYDPATGSFNFTGVMESARYGHTATLLQNGKVLIAGGKSSNATDGGVLSSAELFDPATRTFSPTGNLTVPHANHTATLMPDGRVLIIGGSNGAIPSGGVIATAGMYDPATGIFTQTGSLREARENHRAVLLDNDKVLVAGGDNGQAVLTSAELYDSTSSSGAFITAGNMTTPRSQFMAELLSNGQVLVSGGLTGYVEGALSSTADLYTPAVP